VPGLAGLRLRRNEFGLQIEIPSREYQQLSRGSSAPRASIGKIGGKLGQDFRRPKRAGIRDSSRCWTWTGKIWGYRANH
jgi:hypothetical protein